MFRDEFKERYTTIPFAIYRAYCDHHAMEVISHQHREIELIAMTDGAANFYIDSHLRRVEAGDILVIPPYALHRAEISPNTLTSYFCICFDLNLLCDEELRSGLEENTLSTTHLIDRKKPYAKALADGIQNAYLACEQSKTGWELEAIGNMSLFFSILKKNACFTPKLKDKHEKEFGKRTMAYITDNFSEPISSRTAAGALYITHSYFCRLFKKTFGCSFEKYILAYRLEKARLCLENTKMPVSQITFQTGFNSCSYFGKSFKEKYGVSPLAYRKSIRQAAGTSTHTDI